MRPRASALPARNQGKSSKRAHSTGHETCPPACIEAPTQRADSPQRPLRAPSDVAMASFGPRKFAKVLDGRGFVCFVSGFGRLERAQMPLPAVDIDDMLIRFEHTTSKG